MNEIQPLREVYSVLFVCDLWYWISIDILPNGVGPGCHSYQNSYTHILILQDAWLMNTFKQGNTILQLTCNNYEVVPHHLLYYGLKNQ